MSFKNQFLIIFLSIFILLVSGLFVFRNILKNEQNIAFAESRRYESYLLADELRQSSDDLTRMARTYTVTANPQFREYFNKILEIRDGKTPRPINYNAFYWDFVTAEHIYPSTPADREISLKDLMKRKNFTRDEMSLLREAQRRSDALVQLENRAMNAMVGLYPDEKGRFTVRKEPNQTLARNIMHSPEYHRVKKDIMEPLKEFFQKVDQRTAQTIAFYMNKGRRLNQLLLFLISLTVFLVFLSFVLIFYQSRLGEKSFQQWKQADNWKRRLFFVFASWPIFILALSIFFINYGFFWWLGKQVTEQVVTRRGKDLQIILETTHKSSRQWMNSTEQALKSFVAFSPIKELYDNKMTMEKEEWQRVVKKELDSFITINQYTNYFLLNSFGNILMSNKKEVMGTNLLSALPEKFLKRIGETKNATVLFPEAPPEKMGFSFRRNILAGVYIPLQKTKSFGILIVEIPLSGEFSEIMKAGWFRNSGESYVFSRSGWLLNESRFMDQLYRAGLIPEGKSSALSVRLIDPGINLMLYPESQINRSQKKPTTMVLNALKSLRGSELKPHNDYRGVPVIGSWFWDGKYNIGFAAKIDSQEAFGDFYELKRRSYYQLIIRLILLLALTIVFVWNKAVFSELNEKLQKAYKTVKTHTDRMEEELNIGRQIQMSMVPSDFPKQDDFSLYAQLNPVRELGGDFYDFFLLDKNRFCFFIGDISGKGVPSALFMAVTKTLIRSSAFRQKSTDKILSEVNNNITLNNPYCMFATIFIAVLDLSTGECQYTSAGHHSSYVKKQNGNLLVLDQTHGPVAGAMENVKFSKGNLFLQRGDILVAYTDGITEAVNEKNTLYGEERLEDLLKNGRFDSAKGLIDSVIQGVLDFSGTSSQSDDIAVIAVKYTGGAA